MGAILRKGWMKKEWAKYPVGSKVKCVADKIYYSGCCGVVEGYGIAKDTYPTLHIRITSVPKSDWKCPPEVGSLIYGQLLTWWEVSYVSGSY